jgi:hypothetical protein
MNLPVKEVYVNCEFNTFYGIGFSIEALTSEVLEVFYEEESPSWGLCIDFLCFRAIITG